MSVVRIKNVVHCHVGSLEIWIIRVVTHNTVHCHVGSLEMYIRGN